MNIGSLIPLLAAVIALWFAFLLGHQYVKRRKWHQFWWGLSMLSYACASFGEFYALAFGWNVPMYKFYYFNAVSLVAIMAAGEVYLLANKRQVVGHAYALLTMIGVVWFAALLFPVQPDLAALAQHDVAVGGNALAQSSVIRTVFPPVLSGIGGLLLIIGPLLSWWKSRFRGNLFIAGGAVVLSVAGRLAVLGYPQLLPLAELLGIFLIFYGVVGIARRQQQAYSQSHVEETSPVR